MEIDKSRYFVKKEKAPTHELAATVNLFRDFMGEKEFCGKFKDTLKKTKEEQAYSFWCTKCKNTPYSQALEIIKGLETLPISYSKAGTIINKLKNVGRTKTK